MRINIQRTRPLTAETLAKLEAEYGPIPDSYRVFLSQYDGTTPEENIFKVDERRSAGVERFIPAADIIRIRGAVEGFPMEMLPFASSSGGNLIYLDPKLATIHYWDHEDDSCDVKVANSFDEFLALLEKFDLQQIKLKPKQVKKVRVNPDFKPKF